MFKNKPRFARILLGAVYLVFGLNGFYPIVPVPAMPPSAASFLGAIFQTGYLFPLIKTTESICGALLLANLWVSLVLVVLAPITLNILLFHLFLALSGLPAAILIAFLHAFLILNRRRRYESLLKRNS